MKNEFLSIILLSLFAVNTYGAEPTPAPAKAQDSSDATSDTTTEDGTCDLISDKELEELIKLLTCDTNEQADAAQSNAANDEVPKASNEITQDASMSMPISSERDQMTAPEENTSAAIDNTTNAPSNAMDTVGTTVGNVAGAATNVAANTVDTVTDVAANTVNTATNAVANTANAVTNAASNAVNTVTGVFKK